MSKLSYVLLMIVALFVVNSTEAKKKKYPNGDYYEGKWKKKSPHGFGTMTYANGDVYSGNWVYGSREGQGTMTYKESLYEEYSGEWKADKPEGLGKLTFLDGSVYEGCFVAGLYQGQGKMTYKNGDVYEGNWENGKISGTGKLTYSTGDKFVGVFTEYGRTGKLSKNSGEWYEGEWKNGKFINGRCSINNGDVKYAGEIKNGKYYNGKGNLDIDGERFDGTWTNGNFKGTSVLNGIKFVGDVTSDGRMSGKVYYSNQDLTNPASLNPIIVQSYTEMLRHTKRTKGIEPKVGVNLIFEGHNLVFEGNVVKCSWPLNKTKEAEIYVPSGKGVLSFVGNDGSVNTISGYWQKGVLSALDSGTVYVDKTPYSLFIYEGKKLKVVDEYIDFSISMKFDEMPSSVLGLADKIAANADKIEEENNLTANAGKIEKKNNLYETKFKDKAFIFVGTYDQVEPEASMFFNVRAIDVMFAIVPDNGERLLNVQMALVNPKRLGRKEDRPTMLALFTMAKNLIKKDFYTYVVKDGYLSFNGKKYKLLNNYTALYDEDKGLTYKLMTLPQLKKLFARFTQQ